MIKQITVVLIAFATLFGNATAQYAGWPNSGSLFILTTPEGADLPATASEDNFPVLVKLVKGVFDFSKAKANGEDIRFLADGKPLAYQIEEWDDAKGTASIWVRVPNIKGNARQEIKMFWGKADAATESNGSAVFNESNGFACVLHMDEALKDELGSVTPKDEGGATVAAGIVGKGRHFVPGKGIPCGDHIKNFPYSDMPFTSELWFRGEIAGATLFSWGRYATRFNGKTGDGNLVDIQLRSPAALGWASDGPGGCAAKTIPIMNQWYHVAATYSEGTSRIYVNGQLDGTNYHKAAMSLMNDIYMNIGRETYSGDIDEVRVSRVARSDNWMKMEYENQKAGQTLVGVLVQSGNSFSVSPSSIKIDEGKKVTVTAKVGGAQKLYWIIKKDGVDTIAAVDQYAYELDAGRVVADTSYTLQLKAVYASEVKTKDIPVKVKEEIPEPEFTLKAPSKWNGRDIIEVVPDIRNLKAMEAKGAGELHYSWTISGGAVIKSFADDVSDGKTPSAVATALRRRVLILERSQYTGPITVKAAINNGGADSVATTTIKITEPKSDPWVQWTPSKDEKPVDNQFFARDDKNQGALYYNGTISDAVDAVFLKLYADDMLIKTEKQKLSADKGYAFAMKLKPGLIKYKVEFGTKAGGNETVLRTVTNLICGDAYIIDGQSNAEACGPNNGPNEDPVTPLNDWVRSYGNYLSGTTNGGWGNAVRMHIWGRPNCGQHSIGAWGIVLATNLVAKYQIPICIINGAIGGTQIWHHQVNPTNRFDTSGEFYRNPYKIYGSLLTRVTGARLTHGIRGVIWFQGENDSGAGAPTGDWNYKSYQQYFVEMAAAWKTDYPNIKHYYIYQVWPAPCNMGPKDDGIREAQRTLSRLFSNLRVMSIIGAAGPHAGRGSGHFELEVYAQFARFMSPLIEVDNYGLSSKQEVTAPDLKCAWYTSAARDEIALDFGQPVVWKEEIKKDIYLDDIVAPVSSGSVSGNIITLKLSAPSNAKTIAHISGHHWDGKPESIIFGVNGIAALTFCDVTIASTEEARMRGFMRKQ